jgi:hypothetical protein
VRHLTGIVEAPEHCGFLSPIQTFPERTINCVVFSADDAESSDPVLAVDYVVSAISAAGHVNYAERFPLEIIGNSGDPHTVDGALHRLIHKQDRGIDLNELISRHAGRSH